MFSDVEIANDALVRLGAEKINSLSEDSENARKVSGIWKISRDKVLVAHPWGFATYRKALEKLSATPAYDLSVYFQYPSNCLRIYEVWPKYANWKREEGSMIASDTDPLYCRYIKRVEDVALWSMGFVTAFTGRLASDLAYPITNSRALATDLKTEYLSVDLPDGKAIDSQEGTEEKHDEEAAWIQERF